MVHFQEGDSFILGRGSNPDFMNLDGAYGREGAKELEGIDQIPSEQGAFLEQTPQVSISTSFQIARCSQGLPGFSTISKRIFCCLKLVISLAESGPMGFITIFQNHLEWYVWFSFSKHLEQI